jgi:uncharacterized protein (TIGR02145 family)
MKQKGIFIIIISIYMVFNLKIVVGSYCDNQNNNHADYSYNLNTNTTEKNKDSYSDPQNFRELFKLLSGDFYNHEEFLTALGFWVNIFFTTADIALEGDHFAYEEVEKYVLGNSPFQRIIEYHIQNYINVYPDSYDKFFNKYGHGIQYRMDLLEELHQKKVADYEKKMASIIDQERQEIQRQELLEKQLEQDRAEAEKRIREDRIRRDIERRSGTYKDPRDGLIYKTIKIGNQEWMAENLAWMPEVHHPYNEARRWGRPNITKSKYYVYGYFGEDLNEAQKAPNYQKYGVLYNWVAAKDACPPGWRLSSDKDWIVLETFLGMKKEEAEQYYRKGLVFSGHSGNRGSDEGAKLMSRFEDPSVNVRENELWNEKANNSSGFSAIPAGYMSYIEFTAIGAYASFWTSSGSRNHKIYRILSCWRETIYRSTSNMRYRGKSVRCIRD